MNYGNELLYIEEDKILNLRHVSHITLDYSKDKIIFKMDYATNVTPRKRSEDKDSQSYNLHEDKVIPLKKVVTGYVYVYGIQNILNKLKSKKYFSDNFIQKSLEYNDATDVGWINMERVSSLKFDRSRNRTVINFSNTVSYYDFGVKDEVLTSEFLYLDFFKDDKFNKYVEYVKKTLGE